MTITDRINPSRLLLVAAMVLILGPVAVALGALVRIHGLCVYDDAWHAVISKNLAHGLGYTHTLRHDGPGSPMHPFDPATSTGPVSILPVAAAIAVFGARSWVPGATHVALEVVLLAVAFLLLARRYSVARVSLFMIAAVILIALVSGKEIVSWSVQLGEPVAALLVLCGIIVWSTSSRSRAAAGCAGLLAGLAVLTKELAAVYAIGFAGVLVAGQVMTYKKSRDLRAGLRVVAAFALAGLAPIIAFEAWRLATLGFRGFLRNWYQHFAHVRYVSTARPHGLPDILLRAAERLSVAKKAYGIGIPMALTFAVVVVVIIYRGRHEDGMRATALLLVGILLHWLYWLFASNGWERYLFMAEVLWCFLIALPILLNGGVWRNGLPALGAIAIIVLFSWPRLNLIRSAWLAPGGHLQEPNRVEYEVVDYLDGHAGRGPIYISWWAHIAPLEYFSAVPGRFWGGATSMLHEPGGPIYVVINRGLIEMKLAVDLDLVRSLAPCGQPVLVRRPYEVYLCSRTVEAGASGRER